jgi:hypothetical protein
MPLMLIGSFIHNEMEKYFPSEQLIRGFSSEERWENIWGNHLRTGVSL